MASHKKHAQPTTFALPGKSQMVKIVATVAAVGLLATGGIVSHNLYATAEKSPAKQVTAYSVTDSIEASRGNAREALSGDTVRHREDQRQDPRGSRHAFHRREVRA